MKHRLLCTWIALIGLAGAASPASAAGLDWEVDEQPTNAGVRALRNFRDGVIGLFDDATDLQLGVFSEASLLLSTGLMAVSDLIGVIDDNPVSQHVFKAVASKSLAKTSFLLHSVGSEAVLGSHGLEAESWASQALDDLNPLLDDDEPRGLPLDPMSFVGEGMFHGDAYMARIPGRILLTAVVTDGVIRPVGSLMEAASMTGPAKTLEDMARNWMRKAVNE